MLREPVTFERITRVSDGAGSFTETWGGVSGAPTMAHARMTGGNEVRHGDRIEARSGAIIVVRYFDGVLETDRVVMRSRRYNIRSIVNVDMADMWLEIRMDGGVAL